MQRYKKISILNSQFSIDWLSHLGFLAVIGLSAWFHELRSTFGESAMHLFHLINDPQIFSNAGLFSVHWFQNVLTVFAINANASLSFVSLVFSVTPAIFLYSIFLITRYGFQQKKSGILLLFLLFGINQTFFIAVHTPLILIATFYLIIEGIRAIWRKHRSDFRPEIEMAIWGLACLLLFFSIRISPNVYQDVIVGMHNFSLIGYFLNVAIGTFVISFLMAAFLVLFWFHQKQKKTLKEFGAWIALALAFISIYGQSGFVDVNFELLFFPLIAILVGGFVVFFGDKLQQPGKRFWILCALVIFAVFGQLRTLPEFQARQNYVVRLLDHAPKTADKFALPEHLQELSRYIDPTFLAFETPLIASLRGRPVQSIFFIPERNPETIPNLFNHTFNENYFQFSNLNYTVLNESIIPRSLDSLFIFDEITALGEDRQFGLTLQHRLQRNDSLSLSVWRKGSDFGHLVISDNDVRNHRLWMSEQYISEPNADGWQKLSIDFVIETRDRYRIYFMNANYRQERIYFKNFRVEIWRE